MGKLIIFARYVVISCKAKLFVFDIGFEQQKARIIDVPPKTLNGENGKTNKMHIGDELLCIAVSKCAQYLAGTTQSKRVILWNTSSWSYIKEFSIIKIPTALVFLTDSTKLVIADKSGDVYDFPVSENIVSDAKSNIDQRSCLDNETEPEQLLGHLSMLLDLTITDDDKFIITCDRDEKIRVSSYPNCYSIHSYCLGHTEFVSQLKLLPNRSNDRLLSASGDRTVKFWDFLSGKCLATLDVRLHIETYLGKYFQDSEKNNLEDNEMKINFNTFITKLDVISDRDGSYVVAISLYRLPVLLLYKLESESSFKHLHSLETASPVIDFVFSDNGEILAYLENMEDQSDSSPDPLTVFKLSEDLCSFHQVADHPLVTFGREYREKLKGTYVWSFDANTLFKHKFDNVSDYQKKKQERLNIKTVLPLKRKSSE